MYIHIMRTKKIESRERASKEKISFSTFTCIHVAKKLASDKHSNGLDSKINEGQCLKQIKSSSYRKSWNKARNNNNNNTTQTTFATVTYFFFSHSLLLKVW